MGCPNSVNYKKLLTLNEAAQELGVTIDALIEWNDLNILKPTISLSGEVGYTQEQIDKFRAIQKVTSELKLTSKTELSQNQITNVNIGTEDKVISPIRQEINENLMIENFKPKEKGAIFLKQNSRKFSLINFLYFLFAIIIPLAIIIIMQQGKLDPLLNFLVSQKEEKIKTALISETNKAYLVDLKTSGVRTDEKNPSENNLKNLNKSALSSVFNVNLKKNTQTSTASGRIPQKDLASAKTASVAGINNIGYSARGNILVGTSSPDSLFDPHGNIKGEKGKSDILAMNFEAIREVVGDNSLKQATNINAVLIFFGVGLAFLIFLLRRQIFIPAGATATADIPHEEKIILEINQKTDGTVVLCFRDKEYKICKPDMDSESDQFIERLMGLTASKIREFDYDTTVDNQAGFNAPLSKLVTRLGFVGLKRDLFFPRTSKNSVLFRRYITEHDLNSMNISPDQIIKEFLTTN